MPKRKNRVCVFTTEEKERLLEVAKAERLGIGIITVVFTGIRIGELLGLQWKDIDFENAVLTVTHSLNGNKEIIEQPMKFRRKIPLHEELLKELKKFKNLQNNEKKVAEHLYEDADFIIADKLGKPVDLKTYQRIFHKLLEKVNIKKADFYCIRHTFAKMLLENDVHIKTVSEILGHKNVAVTIKMYS